MNTQYLPTVAIGAAIVLFIIYQQLRTRPVEGRQLVVLPLILAVLGFINLNHQPPATSAAVTALVASLASAVVFGLARGRSMRVWQDAGSVLRQGAPITLALWIIAIALRIGIGAIARRAGVAQSVTFGELPLFLGVTLAAQNLVIWMRAQAIGVPTRIRGQSAQSSAPGLHGAGGGGAGGGPCVQPPALRCGWGYGASRLRRISTTAFTGPPPPAATMWL